MVMQVEKSHLPVVKYSAVKIVPPRSLRGEDLKNVSVRRTKASLDPERRNAMIAEAAYYRAEHRGFESGFEVEDWLCAEAEIDGKWADGEIPLASAFDSSE